MIQSFVKCFNPYFNSIKVRLEQLLPCFVQELNPFQFHKGAIRTLNYAQAKAAFANFNSIKVRLEQTVLMSSLSTSVYFNSIKVRLELLRCHVLSSLLLYFNSIKVRLEQ